MMIFRLKNLKPLFFFLLLGAVSISELLYIVFPMTLLGKNIFLVGPFFIVFFIIVHFIVFRNFKEMVPTILCFGLLIAFMILVSFMHLILYDQSLSFFSYRFIFQIALAAGLTVVMLDSIGRDQLYYVLFSVILLVSFIQGTGYYVLPEIQIVKSVDSLPVIIFDGESRRDGLLGSSLVAYHSVLALFALTSRERMSLFNWFLVGCIVLIIFACQTRIAIIFMMIILLSQFFSRVRVKKLGYWFFAGALFLIVAEIVGGFSEALWLALNRFDINLSDDPRVLKTILSLNLISESFHGFLWGLPIETITQATLGGFQVSDNSFFLVLLRFGFIFFIVWVGSIIYLISRFNRLRVLYWIWIFFALFTTNSILWDSFIFCLIGMAAVLGQNIGEKNSFSINEKPKLS